MKTAIVTGSSKGIGQAITHKLLEEGWQVIGLSRTYLELQTSSFISYPIDLEDTSSLPKHLGDIVRLYPGVDALICNAGCGKFGNIEELSYSDMLSLLHLNFLSQAYLVKAFLPQLKKRQQGHIIFMGSEAALQGKKQGSIYCASKFALRGFAQALREECATSHIRVSIVNPGMVHSDFFAKLHFAPGTDPFEHILPEDVALAVLFLLQTREGTVVDEINLSPQKKKIIFSPRNS